MPAASCKKPAAYYLIHLYLFKKGRELHTYGNNKQAASCQLPVADINFQKVGTRFNPYNSPDNIIFKINAIPVEGFSNFQRHINETTKYGPDKQPLGSNCCPAKKRSKHRTT